MTSCALHPCFVFNTPLLCFALWASTNLIQCSKRTGSPSTFLMEGAIKRIKISLLLFVCFILLYIRSSRSKYNAAIANCLWGFFVFFYMLSCISCVYLSFSLFLMYIILSLVLFVSTLSVIENYVMVWVKLEVKYFELSSNIALWSGKVIFILFY